MVALGECTLTLFQSAPAIAGGRIVETGRGWGQAGCFNPRPPLLAGESCGSGLACKLSACFNPRPPLLAGESKPPLAVMSFISFQSAPAIAGGRIDIWGNATPASISVSIRARHCWRANPPTPGRRWARRSVSIRARHCWRANPAKMLMSMPIWVFQSAPAIAGGRISPSDQP